MEEREIVNGIPVYDVVFDSSYNLGITAISLVERPAIEVDFLAFKDIKEPMFYKLVSEERQEIVSPVLIPEKLIYREDRDGKPFYIKFSKEIIENLAWNFYVNGRCSNVNIDHPTTSADNAFSYLLEDIECLDTWIIESEDDRAYTEYGFTKEITPEGTWFIHYKVGDLLWGQIKEGNLKGLSVEAFIGIS